MNLINVVAKFKTEDECIDHLIAMRWPLGVCCIKCGGQNITEMRMAASKRKNGKFIPARRLFRCMNEGAKCFGYQFSAKTGTIFDSTHLPLKIWFMTIGLITGAKKGMSAMQVARHLDMESSYKTVWYLCHRVREAMKENFQLTGEVEADTTHIGGRRPRIGNPRTKKEKKDIVLGMVERGGRVRLIPVPDEKRSILQPVLEQHVSENVDVIYTDEHPIFPYATGGKFPGKHQTINHSRAYAIGRNHTNTIENAFSLFKRGLMGSFHQVSIKHLSRYCEEFSYRFNRRGEQASMFDATVKSLARGKALRFKTLIASETANPSDVSQ
jgi:ISXO2-like transposase domain/Transposase zinc-ribbon domain